MQKMLGIDVGGTGIKGAIIDLDTGELLTDRVKLKTIHPATNSSVLGQISELIQLLKWDGEQIGIGFPSVIENGKTLTATNIDKSWINFPIRQAVLDNLGLDAYVINDADAAGLAEFTYNSDIDKSGKTIFITIGTGIGSAFFYNGVLIPNTEFGHLNYKNSIAEKYVSNRARETKVLGWKSYGKALNKYLIHLETVFRPKQIIIGGGISKKMSKYEEYFSLSTPVESAHLLNTAGVIGAALAARDKLLF